MKSGNEGESRHGRDRGGAFRGEAQEGGRGRERKVKGGRELE